MDFTLAWMHYSSRGFLHFAKRDYNPVVFPSSNKRLAKHVLLFNPVHFICKHSTWRISRHIKPKEMMVADG